MNKFVYLKLGLSVVLIFIGVKMLLEPLLHIPILASLGAVGANTRNHYSRFTQVGEDE